MTALSCDLHWFSPHAPLLKVTSGVIHFPGVYHDRGVWGARGGGFKAPPADGNVQYAPACLEGTVTLGITASLFLCGVLQPRMLCSRLERRCNCVRVSLLRSYLVHTSITALHSKERDKLVRFMCSCCDFACLTLPLLQISSNTIS